MDETIRVGVADLNVANHPTKLISLGLGSCVGVALYEKNKKIAGLAHFMLPSSAQVKNNSNEAKFADTAIIKLFDEMVKLGARKEAVVAKLAGGSQMFALAQSTDILRIGYRNVIAAREKLSELGIPIVAEDVGGNFGRTIELNSEDGKLMIKTLGHGVKHI